MTGLANPAPGNTPIDPDELDQLIPSLSTKAELDEWERANILEAYEWAPKWASAEKHRPF